MNKTNTKSEKLCRLCASTINLGYNLLGTSDGIDFSNLIRKYIHVKITKEDILPLKICEECRNTLKAFDEFALKCFRIQEALYGHVNTDLVQENVKFLEEIVKTEPVEENKLKIEEIQLVNENQEDYSDGTLENDGTLETHDYDFNHKKIRSPKGYRRKIVKKLGRPLKHDYSLLKYVCHVCSKEHQNWKQLKEHTLLQHSVKPQTSCFCNSVLFSMKSITKHLNIHCDANKRLCCNECGMVFHTTLKLEKHMRLSHAKEEYMFSCGFCEKKFLQRSLLKVHERKKHLPKELTHIHRCDKCDGIFETSNHLKSHKTFVHNKDSIPKLICDVCGKEFVRKSGLQVHIMTHTSDRKFTCSKCPKSFKGKRMLEKHMNLHENVKYRCTVCSLVLSSKSTLSAHNVVHEDTFRYKCRFCDKQYKRNMDRKHHENRHLGLTPYECPWCPKKFVDNSHLRNHKKTQHPKELAEFEAVHGPPSGTVNRIPTDQNTQIITASIKRSSRYKMEIL